MSKAILREVTITLTMADIFLAGSSAVAGVHVVVGQYWSLGSA